MSSHWAFEFDMLYTSDPSSWEVIVLSRGQTDVSVAQGHRPAFQSFPDHRPPFSSLDSVVAIRVLSYLGFATIAPLPSLWTAQPHWSCECCKVPMAHFICPQGCCDCQFCLGVSLANQFFTAWEFCVCGRSLTDVSVARGHRPVNQPLPCSSSHFLIHWFSHSGVMIRFSMPAIRLFCAGRSCSTLCHSWGLTNVSVALGHCPACGLHISDWESSQGGMLHTWPLLSVLLWLSHLVCGLYLHLHLLLALILIRLWCAPLRVRRGPLGRLVLLPSAGVPTQLALSLGCVGSPRSTWCWADNTVDARRKTRRGRKRPFPHGTSPLLNTGPFRLLASLLLLPSLPCCVWAAPKPFGEALEIVLAAARLAPEPLSVTGTPTATATFQADVSSIVQGELAESTAEARGQQAQVTPLLDAPHLAAPRPDAVMPNAPARRDVTITCFVLSPYYQSETVVLNLPYPFALSTLCTTVKDSLVALRPKFTHILHPTHPQIGRDFASFVLAPKWMSVTSMTIVIFDMRALNGPIYSAYAWDHISFGDCLREARRHQLPAWRVFIAGHSQALQQDAVCIVTLGSVVQFQPEEMPPVWYGTLSSRLDRPNNWGQTPDIPRDNPELPVLVLYHGQRLLYSARRHPNTRARAFIADLVERTPDSVIFATPPDLSLTDVDHLGVACRDVITVYPLSPSPDRQSVLIFLDARQTGNPVESMLIPSGRVDPAELVRFLQLQAPPTFRVAFWPRPNAGGMLRLTEGSTVIFGYSEVSPWDDSESVDSASSGDSDSSGPDDRDGQRFDPVSALFSHHDPSQDPDMNLSYDDGDSSRSRSPRHPESGTHHHTLKGDSLLFCGCKLNVHLSVAHACHGLLEHSADSVFRFPPEGTPVQHKLLEEPTPVNRSELEALDSLAYFAGQFGMPWRYWQAWRIQERLELMPPMPVIEAARTVLVNLAVAVTTPEYELERFSVEILLPCEIADLIGAVQAARRPGRARLFPILVPALPQPSPGWALFAAFPEWDPQACVIILDLRAHDGRLFSVQAPIFVDHDDALRLAGLPCNALVTVHTALDVDILLVGTAVRVFPGQCLRFLPPHASSPRANVLHRMLSDSRGWDLGPAFPLPVLGSCYCCVTDRGHHLFVPDPSQPWAYRQELADSCGVSIERIAVCPASPAVTDCTTFGHVCRTVLAVGTQLSASFFVLIDCRPIMQGWLLCRSTGLLDIAEVIEQLGTFAPMFWSLAICVDAGPPAIAGQVAAASGQVFTAVYVRGQDDAHVLDTAARGDDGHGADGSDDETGSDSPSDTSIADWTFPAPGWDSEPTGDANRPTGGPLGAGSRRSALCSARSANTHAAPTSQRPECRNVARNPCHLSCPVTLKIVLLQWVLSCAATAAPSDQITVSSVILPSSGLDKWSTVYAEDTHSTGPHCLTPVFDRHTASNSTAAAPVVWGRPLPTPARAGRLPACIDIGPTLLEQALATDSGRAFYLACTLLETLQDHFFPPSIQTHHLWSQDPEAIDVAVACPGGPRVSDERATVSLADSLPVSPFQKECLALQDIFRQLDPHGSDWLDCDLRPILHDKHVPLHWRTKFVNVRGWHEHDTPKSHAIHIYTDGSAASNADDLRPCSWAFTVWLDTTQGRMLLGQASATSAVPGSPYYLGEVEDTALVGEQLALAWSLAWVIEHASTFSLPVTFHYDAQGAGRGAFGQWAPPSRNVDPHPGFPCLSDLLVHLRQLASQFAALEHAYVAGHSGQIENELSDQLAKQSRRRPCEYWERVAPTWLSQLAQHKLLPWAWMLYSSAPDLPPLYAMESEARRMQSSDVRPQHAPAPGVVTTEHPECLAELCFTAISYNTLTMRDPKGPGQADADKAGLRIVGRKALLKDQFAALRPLFVGLQETRVPDSNLQPDADYIIFQSASTPQGSLGVALWISKTTPYGHAKGIAQFVLPKHCSVFGTSPRHLALDIDAPNLRLAVIVLHAPTLATATLQEVREFWRARAAEVEKRPSGTDFLLLCDANSRVGSVCTPHVGEHDKEDENEAGTAFRHFLEQIEGYLPSTFETHHVGTSATWVSPFDTYHRIDYIITPVAWSVFRLTSWVLDDFESLQKKDDHWPVALSCAFAKHAPRHWTTQVQRRVARPPRPQTQDQVMQASSVLCKYEPASWYVDVDQHYDQLAIFWAEAGAELEPAVEHRPLQPYLGPDTLKLVRIRKALRAYLRAERLERNRRLLMFGFAAFCLHQRGDTFHAHQLRVLQVWFRDLDHSEAEALYRLLHLGFYLRKIISVDRAKYLAGLADTVRNGDLRDPSSLYASVRKAFPAARSGKRSSYQPLPAIQQESGELAVSATDRIEVWRKHFAAQEAGELVTPEQYVRDFSRYCKPADTTVFDLEVLPTLAEVEGLILGLKRGRAPGPDSVTTETLQVQPALTARQLLPILLKSSMGLREPLTFRGGDLVCLAKRAGATLCCKDYRSILVSSIPGKVHHRKLRSQLTKILEGVRQPLQSGALPGEGIEVIAIAAKTFQLLCDGIRRPWGLAFFDLQSAYYQVIREALVPGCEDDTALLAVFDKLQLPPKALTELKHHLQQLALLPTLNAPEHLTALINDLFRGSWFRISGSALLTVTKRGTRPGDPAADVLFSLSLSALLKSVASDLSSADLLPDIPRPAHRHDWASQGPEEDIGSPAWADDFLQPQTGQDPCDLLARTQRSVQIVTEKATSMGMTVSFGREKTAVMVPNWIDLDSSEVVNHTVDSRPYIPVPNNLTGTTHQLLVVQSYKHLGGILVATSSPLPDVYHRAARANAVVKPLQKRLFGEPTIQLAVRRTLLRSLAMSKFVHTSASLFLHAACHKRVWAQQFVALWRSLFRRRSRTHTEHSYSVLRTACAPAPPLALALTRATFLSKLTRLGPQLLARLLYDHWAMHPANSWLSQLKDDVFQVCLYLPHLRALFPAGQEIPAVLDSLCEDPSWWPGQVKRAVKVFGKDLEVWHERRSRGQAVETPPSVVDKPYQCGFCSASFVLRKHLCVHLSRTHAILAPARHFAPLPYCLACHRHFGLVSRVQQHLKNSDKCLRRLVHLIDPLTPSEIKEAEAPEVLARRKQKAGAWKDFAVPTARPIVFWPLAPVWEERCPPAQASEEHVLISELIPSFRPKPDNVAWIEDHLSKKSREGPRPTAFSFWESRPVSPHA